MATCGREFDATRTAVVGIDAPCDEARSALETTPFRAAQREGRAVASRVTVRVRFELD